MKKIICVCFFLVLTALSSAFVFVEAKSNISKSFFMSSTIQEEVLPRLKTWDSLNAEEKRKAISRFVIA